MYGYGLHCLKNDIKAEKTDFHVTPLLDNQDNKNTIDDNFIDICKRSGIELNDNLPIYLEDCHLGMEYLEYRGFNHEAVDYFTQVYQRKWQQLFKQQNREIVNRHNKLLNNFNDDIDTIITVRANVYTNDNPQTRMDKIYNGSRLWNKLVDNYTYIRGQHGNASFTEIWNLNVNHNYMTNKEAEKIYHEVCYLLGYE